MEYLRLCLQIPQSPGVVKTAQNQQNMLRSEVNHSGYRIYMHWGCTEQVLATLEEGLGTRLT